jgi:EAL domain-containing protein (putative c-di-GMP-specific phosphodiesterase class I)
MATVEAVTPWPAVYGTVGSGRANVGRLVEAANRVIDRRHITTVFQPLVDLETGAVVGYEAFTRGPAGSALEAPLKLLEGARLARRLAEFDWMCAAAACDAVLCAHLHRSMTIFINIQPATMLTTCPEDLRAAIWRAQSNLRVVVDMNEAALTDDPGSLLDAVRVVREAGWGIAIDNAVADPACLAMLPLVRPDVLKLDFRGLRDRLPELAKMGDGARAFAEQTGAAVLVQGIEELDDIGAARMAGAMFGQGWFFGRPGPLPDKAVVPTSVFPLVQAAPVLDHSTPFGIITEHNPAVIAEERYLVPLMRSVEEQVDTNGPPALLLEALEDGWSQQPGTSARLRQLAERAAFFAVLGAGISVSPPTSPTTRTGSLGPSDPLASEWDVVVLGPHYAVAASARPVDSTATGPSRLYEYAVTHDRDTIVRAAQVMWARLPRRAPTLGVEL